MKLNPLLAAALIGAGTLATTAAHAAATSWDPSWAFSGFGTVGYVKTDTDQALFAVPPAALGADKDGTLGVDSRVGAQVTLKANNVFSATVQALSERNGKGNFKPAVEWAFLKAQVTPELSVRAGRIGLPLFAVSDFRKVGFSNLWLRTPLDVYGQVGFSHFDGADAIYQASVGSTTLTGQVFTGTSSAWNDGTNVHVRKQIGFNLTAEFDNGITLRVGRDQGKLTVDNSNLDQLVAILGATATQVAIPALAATGAQLDSHDKDASFTGVGVALDHENWVGSFEFTKRKTSSYVSSTTGWALTGGYRIGTFTPYVVVSKLKRDSDNVDTTTLNAVPPLAQLAAITNATLASQDVSQKTNSVGVRWDAYKNIDVKAQYDRIKPGTGAKGLFNETQPGFSGDVSVYSLAVDFVF
jgi:hypothetical protein